MEDVPKAGGLRLLVSPACFFWLMHTEHNGGAVKGEHGEMRDD
jgi:hypothetical protein